MDRQLPHDHKDELNDKDLKATPARIAIMDLLEKTNEPVDVQMVAGYLEKQAIDTDRATIFRILNMFTDRGITKRIFLNEGKYRYELADQEDHHHLICEACGAIDDIADCDLSKIEQDILRKKGFMVKHHSLEFFGVCQACVTKQA